MSGETGLDAMDEGIGVAPVLDEATCEIRVSTRASGSLGSVTLDFERAGVERVLEEEALVLSLMAAVTLGQAAMARQIGLPAPVRPSLIGIGAGLARLHYDAHAFAQRLESWTYPRLLVSTRVDGDRSPGAGIPARNEQRVVLLWSGGKDALASLRVLRANALEVIALHVTANDTVRELEQRAARTLAVEEGVDLLEVRLDWPLLSEALARWSTSTGVFPLRNPVAHGRDLVLLAAAGIVARRVGAGYVAAGYEKDLWEKQVPYRSHVIYRHDAQSRPAGELVDRLLRESLGVGFFSPICGLREFVLLDWLLSEEDQLWRQLVSCFWGDWCGRCRKCLRYCLRQRAVGVDRISFQTDPLAQGSPALEALLDALLDEATPYWEQQVADLFTLQSRGGFGRSATATLLDRFAGWHASNSGLLAERLRRPGPTELAPQGFDPRNQPALVPFTVKRAFN